MKHLIGIIVIVAMNACGDDGQTAGPKYVTTDAGAKLEVGIRNCSTIGASGISLTQQQCEACQGRACSTSGCNIYPCINDQAVIQTCKEDSDCSMVGAAFCGELASKNIHYVCTSVTTDALRLMQP